ncbi:MAG: type II secretion system F family protein [Deltaproteobacteria bacterium]|nr:type II secretion system F family protein [Deltaproteobacteria bacterium]
MSTFEYVAWDQSGNCVESIKQASSQEEVLTFLREEHLTPVSINEIQTAKQEKAETVSYKRVKSADLATFCWQLSTMLAGGLPITTAIDTIADEIPNPYFEFVLKDIAAKLSKGLTLADCFEEYTKVFSKLSCAMVMAGETGGSLTTTLQRLAEHYENRDKLIRKVRGAMAYPTFVIIFIVLIIIVLMTFIIPRFTTMFDEFNGELPGFTKAFMAVYDVIMKNSPLMLIGGLIAAVSLVFYSKTIKGHHNISKFILSVPILGKIILMAFVATFCRTLSTLVSSGVPVLDAFGILSGMTDNDVLRDGVLKTREKMVEGMSISQSMEIVGFFPGVSIKMAQIGENSGSLSSVMDKTSEYYEKKVDSLVSMMLGMLEPILIVVVGSIVLVVILAMYLPIFSMTPG